MGLADLRAGLGAGVGPQQHDAALLVERAEHQYLGHEGPDLTRWEIDHRNHQGVNQLVAVVMGDLRRGALDARLGAEVDGQLQRRPAGLGKLLDRENPADAHVDGLEVREVDHEFGAGQEPGAPLLIEGGRTEWSLRPDDKLGLGAAISGAGVVTVGVVAELVGAVEVGVVVDVGVVAVVGPVVVGPVVVGVGVAVVVGVVLGSAAGGAAVGPEAVGSDGAGVAAGGGVAAVALLPVAGGVSTVGSVVVWLRPAGVALVFTGIFAVEVGAGVVAAGLPLVVARSALVFAVTAATRRWWTPTTSVERGSGWEAIGVTAACWAGTAGVTAATVVA